MTPYNVNERMKWKMDITCKVFDDYTCQQYSTFLLCFILYINILKDGYYFLLLLFKVVQNFHKKMLKYFF